MLLIEKNVITLWVEKEEASCGNVKAFFHFDTPSLVFYLTPR